MEDKIFQITPTTIQVGPDNTTQESEPEVESTENNAGENQ